MIDELEELFNQCDYPFVTATASDKPLGNYCAENYQDIEALLEALFLKEVTTKTF